MMILMLPIEINNKNAITTKKRRSCFTKEFKCFLWCLQLNSLLAEIIERTEVICSANWNGCWFLNKAGERQNKQKLFGHFLTHLMQKSWSQHDAQIDFLISLKQIGHEKIAINW
jgi:hypothetical protein